MRETNAPIRKKSFFIFALAVSLLAAGAARIVPHGVFSRSHGADWQFYCGVGGMAAGWILALKLREVPTVPFWAVTIALRMILLPMEAGADIHRYVWEGRIQAHGFDPYAHAPIDDVLAPLRDANWAEVEFKSISAIYPPLAELGFRLLADLSQSVLLFKLAFIAADLAVCFLLRARFGARRSVLYAWNPLILYSFAGGAHYDSWFGLCLVAAWLFWENGAFHRAAATLGMAVALKWISLPILIWALWRIARSRGVRSMLIAAGAGALPFTLAWLVVTKGNPGSALFPSAFALYARSTELIPAIVSWLWPSANLSNAAYLLPLGAVTLLLFSTPIMTLFCERWFFCLLVLSPVVTPWYFTWLIPFAVESGNLGVAAVSISAFAYFGITSLPAMPQTGWPLVLLQTAIVWLPFVFGFAWQEWRRARLQPSRVASDQSSQSRRTS